MMRYRKLPLTKSLGIVLRRGAAVAVLAGALAMACSAWGADAPPPAGQVRFDFETGTLQGWQVVEGKFGRVVTDRATYHNGGAPYASRQGKFHLSTLESVNNAPEDPLQGVIESPVFLLAGPELSFLIGGGSHGNTSVVLCTLDGKEQAQAHGSNTEAMSRVQWKLPHLVGKKVFLRVFDNNGGPWGHVTLDDVVATGRLDPQATSARFAKRRRVLPWFPRGSGSVETFRLAVADLISTFGDRYIGGKGFLSELEAIDKLANDESADQAALAEKLLALRRRALLANPLVSEQPLVYALRGQYAGDHHNTATMFQTGECNTGSFRGPGALKTIDLKTGKTSLLVNVPAGIARDPEVRWDGKRIVFSMRKNVRDDYHLYEINADGTGLKQLTSGSGISDIDPFYLADGRIAFSSTREPKYCMCNIHIMCNLFVMDADGANIHQISKNTLHDAHGTLMEDGRILYDRWEYVDRNFGDAQALWTCNPDGTQHLGYYGNNTPTPGGVIDARQIPGTQWVVALLGVCHGVPSGALAIIDRGYGVDGRPPVIRTWPVSAVGGVRDPGTANGAWDNLGGSYEDPFPLSDKYFLVSRGGAIFLLDMFGNEVQVHAEHPGCYDPQPIAPRPIPPVIPTRRDFENKEGTFYVYDVYQGTHMAGVKKGAVKFLRVVETGEKRNWTGPAWSGQGVERPAMNWHDFTNKRILGTVPVEADGSAHFAVPSDRFVYFQLLDEKGMMVQSMRSGTLVQSGERTGCIGCHENRLTAPPVATAHVPRALQRPPSKLTGWRGPARFHNYLSETQPVWDRNCIKCHDFGKEGAEKLVLAGDKNGAFNMSYMRLWQSGLLRVVGAGPAEIQQAYSWGSHATPLVQTIMKGHHDVKLSDEDFDRMVTWVDLNAPYYPTYDSRFPNGAYGRSPGGAPHVNDMEICYDRPEMSPGLANLKNDPTKYNAALAAIRVAKATLAKTPRADMPGFVPCPTDQARLLKYAGRREMEWKSRQALREGRKFYEAAGSRTNVVAVPTEK